MARFIDDDVGGAVAPLHPATSPEFQKPRRGLVTAGLSFLDGISIGLGGWLISKVAPDLYDEYEKLREENPGAATVGDIVSFASPGWTLSLGKAMFKAPKFIMKYLKGRSKKEFAEKAAKESVETAGKTTIKSADDAAEKLAVWSANASNVKKTAEKLELSAEATKFVVQFIMAFKISVVAGHDITTATVRALTASAVAGGGRALVGKAAESNIKFLKKIIGGSDTARRKIAEALAPILGFNFVFDTPLAESASTIMEVLERELFGEDEPQPKNRGGLIVYKRRM